MEQVLNTEEYQEHIVIMFTMVCLGLNYFVDNQTNVQCTLLIKHVPIIITH